MAPESLRGEPTLPDSEDPGAPTRWWGYAGGLLLGLAAALLNHLFAPPLLSEETPQFLFGTALVLFAFLRFGEGPGLLAAIIQSAALAPTVVPIGTRLILVVIPLVPLIEAWSVWRLHRRVQSPMVAAVIFWLGFGWILDLVGYGAIGGLPLGYLGLLYVKQIINGTLNALIADLACRMLPVRWRGPDHDRPVPIRSLIRARLFLFAVPPLIGLGLLYVRSSFVQVIQHVQAEQRRDAATLASEIHRTLDSAEVDLLQLASRAEMLGRPASVRVALMEFHRRHPEYINLAVTDSTGRVVAVTPDTTLDGSPLTGVTVNARGYFQEARRALRPVSSPLISGGLHIRSPAPEPIMVRAIPLTASGTFQGILLAALDVTTFAPLVAATAGPDEAVTLFDDERQVIVSSSPGFPSGTALMSRLPAGTDLGAPSGDFRYSPSEREPAAHFVPDLRYAAFTLIGARGWGVMVDRLSTSLHEALLPAIGRILAALVVLVLLMGAVMSRFSRELAGPLLSVAREARSVTRGQSTERSRLEALRTSLAAEMRDLGADFEQMAAAVAERQTRSKARVGEVEDRFRAAFQNPVLGQVHAEPGGRVLRANERAAEIFELSQEELRRHPFGVPPLAGADASLEDAVAQLVRGEASAVAREGTVRRGGGAAAIRVILTLVAPEGGGERFVVVAIEDLSAQRDLERRLAEAQRLEAIGLLAGGVAHDFNNLLTPIMGYAELARDELAPDAPARTDLDSVLKAARRARDLVRQLLAFGRRQTLELRRVEPERLLHDFRTLLLPVVPEPVRVTFRTEPHLGVVDVDAGQIEQVLMNLAVNAIDAMPDGGDLTIEARSERVGSGARGGNELPAGDYVTIDVRDTGAGIEPIAVSKVFEPFFTTKDPGKGTGLGLAMVHGIVAQHRGQVRVASEPGRGSVFTVVLPRIAEGAILTTPPTGVASLTRGAGTVLVAEDEAGVRSLISAVLARRGYTVLAAATGEEAINLAAQHPRPIELLVTDVVMPGISGKQLFERLAVVRPGLIALFTSGYAHDELGEHGLIGGDIAFLQKPFSPEELLAKVSEVTRRSSPL